MALRAVRNHQKQLSSAPYVRPAAVGSGRGVRTATSNFSSVTDTATFPLQKKFGQHLLKNPGILDKLLAAANITSSDTVLEIGPGVSPFSDLIVPIGSSTGNLTVRLLPLARRVVALEIDSRMLSEVGKRAQSLGFSNLELLHADALRADLGAFDVCAANLPYQISSPFLFKLLAHRHPFRCAVLMFQKEFGERLLSRPGERNFCRLSANVHLFASVTRVCNVDRNSFRPPPKVDSVIVKITPKHQLLPVDFREWNGLLRVCFTRKRKTLRSIFKKPSVLGMLEQNHKVACALKKKIPEGGSAFRSLCFEALEESGLAGSRSVQIGINDFCKLLLAFHKRDIFFQHAGPLLQGDCDINASNMKAVEEMIMTGDLGDCDVEVESDDEKS